MKFVSTQGRVFKIDLRPSRWARRKEEDCKSKFQFNTGKVIDDTFPGEIVLEEFYVPGDRLYIDFFIPRRRLAIEAHGNQHYKYSAFFHGDVEGFKRSQARDKKKILWCTHNEIRLVVVRQSDDYEEIVNKLLSD